MLDDTVTKIKAFKQRRGLRNSTLAKKAHLSANALRGIDSPEWAPRYDTLKKLLAYIEVEEAVEREGQSSDGKAA